MAEQRKKLRLGELLVQQGLITTDQLSIALAEQRHNHVAIGRLLVRLGFVTESAIRDIMARTIGQESIDLAQVVADAEALKLVAQEFARRNRVLPIAFDPAEQVLKIATTEIFKVVAMDQLRAMLGPNVEIKTLLAAEAQLEDYIDQFYGYELSVDGILKEIETGEIDYESLQGGGDEYTQPMVRLVNALLVDAVKRGASDIHFEPEYAFMRIRYRIDGVLETVRSLHKTYMPGITVRVKVVSSMNIAESRSPQDGRLSLTLNGRPVDFRVSTQPTIYGENIVLRVLDREKSIISLDRMNLAKETLAKLDLMLARPEGIDRKSTRLNSSHLGISYAVFCLKKKNNISLQLLLKTRAYHRHVINQYRRWKIQDTQYRHIHIAMTIRDEARCETCQQNRQLHTV